MSNIQKETKKNSLKFEFVSAKTKKSEDECMLFVMLIDYAENCETVKSTSNY